MIVSHRHRFIFLKTKKTAGTSLEIALSRLCGPEDVITPISPEDEATRRELGYPGPQNHLLRLGQYRWKDWRRRLAEGRPGAFKNHTQARRLRNRLPGHVWRSYFKFCVERNPWDRAISSYYWYTRDESPRPPLERWLREARRGRLSNFDIYAIRGRVAVDRVLHYERLDEELSLVVRELGLPGDLGLPRAKGAHRADRRPYGEVLSDEARELVSEICAREIAALDYRF